MQLTFLCQTDVERQNVNFYFELEGASTQRLSSRVRQIENAAASD